MEKIEQAKSLVEGASEALIGLSAINSGIYGIGFSKEDADEVQAKINEAQKALDDLPIFVGKEELQAELNSIQKDLTEQVEARYVTYEIVDDETDSEKLTLKLPADFWKNGNVDRLENNKAINLQKKDGKVVATYGNFGWNTPEAGDKFGVPFRFNGGKPTLYAILTNNGDGTWDIESDWLVEKE